MADACSKLGHLHQRYEPRLFSSMSRASFILEARYVEPSEVNRHRTDQRTSAIGMVGHHQLPVRDDDFLLIIRAR